CVDKVVLKDWVGEIPGDYVLAWIWKRSGKNSTAEISDNPVCRCCFRKSNTFPAEIYDKICRKLE
ncbi:MAG: hypothetical protein IKA79_03605, partial [Lentisphaeria bacterium]|nr:hypothetical protein [Lentisphaeria bacterium]